MMVEHKNPAERNRRRGSENRQRQKQRCVRLTQAELDTLTAAAKRQRKTLATFLRDAGLRDARALATADSPAWLDDLADASRAAAEAKFGPMGFSDA